MLKLVLFLFLLSYSQQCPRWDNLKSYSINDCVYYDDNGVGKNYWSEHDGNKGNPPNSSVWYWDLCLTTDVKCINQYTDTTITYTDTVIVYDTVRVTLYDTLILKDTNNVSIFDTTFITLQDTNKVILYDTNIITIYDTNIINYIDTVKIDTIVADTILVYLYDTTYINIIDTLYIQDTIVNTINVIKYDTNVVAVRKDSIYTVGVESSILDTFYVLGLDSVYNYIKQDRINDEPKFIVELDYSNLKNDDSVTMEVFIRVYDHVGQFVNDYYITENLTHDNNTIKQKFEYRFLQNVDGNYVSYDGRVFATGVYLVHSMVNIYINDKLDKKEGRLNRIGYKR